MKKMKIVLTALLAASITTAYAAEWDGFSISQTVETEKISPYTTYPPPTNRDSMSTNTGVNFRGYGNIYIPATPAPLPFQNKIAATPDSGARFFLILDYAASASTNDHETPVQSKESIPGNEKVLPANPDTAAPSAITPDVTPNENKVIIDQGTTNSEKSLQTN